MVTFQFLSGLNTIGSNIIDIQSDHGRVIFDYGEIIDSESGSLPDLSHATENTAIFISHLHIDHIGSLEYVPENIPVYMANESYHLYQTLIEVNEELPIKAEVIPVGYDTKVSIGDINVTLKQSDHDVKGVCAFFVQTPDVKLINSGDVRLTGNHPERVIKWVEEAKTFQPDIFLLEGTTFSFEDELPEEELVKEVLDDTPVDKIESEADLYQKWGKLLKENQTKITFLNTYIRNDERLALLSKQTFQEDKIMVLEPKYAYMLKEIEGYTEAFVLEELDTEQQFKDKWLSIKELEKNPGKYVLQNSFANLSLMENFSEGIYCHSNGEPLGDYDPRFEVFTLAIEENNFEFEKLSASGHATKDDLIWIAQEVNAKTTIPWHSMQPKSMSEALASNGINTFLPEREVIYGMARKNKIN